MASSVVFEQIISLIDNDISIKKEDREVYTKDFDNIRNYVINIMKDEDPVFKQIYGGPSLFGSFAENLRLNMPDEFDVHILLKLPFHEMIKVKPDKYRPGFVRLNLSKVLKYMKNHIRSQMVYALFKDFVDGWKCLCRNMVHHWLDEIINRALRRAGNKVQGITGDIYELRYLVRGTAHTIKAVSEDRNISIDLVPAFKFDTLSKWSAKKPFPNDVRKPIWFAVPKPTVGPKRRRNLTFSICVLQVEKHILQNKSNLKSSLRLMKSLRDKMGGYRLKSYFIYTIYLHEIENQDDDFWQKQQKGYLLRHMVDRLLAYLDEEDIPFYWDEDKNLLDGLFEDQIENIKEKFEDISNTLESYHHQPQISYEKIRSLFGKPKEFQTLTKEFL